MLAQKEGIIVPRMLPIEVWMFQTPIMRPRLVEGEGEGEGGGGGRERGGGRGEGEGMRGGRGEGGGRG